MGMAAGPGGGKKRPVSDINVTPMVDVMLVLLVIFVITAPVIKQIDGFEVELPSSLPGEPVQTIETEDARTLVISAEGYVLKPGATDSAESYRNMADLIEDLKIYKDERVKADKQPVVVIAADANVRWQRILEVVNATRSAGITRVTPQIGEGSSGGN